MSLQTWQETLIVAQSDGTALGNSTTETSIIPAAAKLTLPANYYNTIGQVLRCKAWGRISNIVTTPGTLTFRLKFGSTTIVTATAISLNTTAKTNVTFLLEISAILRAIGTSANFMNAGIFTSESVLSSPTGTAGSFMLPASAPAVGSNFDSTASSGLIDLTAQWSVANAGNTLQVHMYTLESVF